MELKLRHNSTFRPSKDRSFAVFAASHAFTDEGWHGRQGGRRRYLDRIKNDIKTSARLVNIRDVSALRGIHRTSEGRRSPGAYV